MKGLVTAIVLTAGSDFDHFLKEEDLSDSFFSGASAVFAPRAKAWFVLDSALSSQGCRGQSLLR
jgi:hypothetical protein